MTSITRALSGKALATTLLLACASQVWAQSDATPAATDKADSAASKMLSCDSLKQKIEDKLAGKGVKHYQLNVVETPEPGLRVVGSCDGGKHKITYSRSEAKSDSGTK